MYDKLSPKTDREIDDDSTDFLPQRAQAPDLSRLRALFARRFRLMLGVGFIVFALVALVTLEMKPRYTAAAQVLLDPRHEKVLETQQVTPNLPPDSAVVDTEVQVLSSRSLARRVVDALNLDQDPEFNARLRPRGLLSHAPRPPPSSAIEIGAEKDAIANQLLGGLKVSRQGLTYVITVSYTSLSAVKAARIANAFADLYLTEQLEAKFDATRRANQWLNDRLAGLRSQAESADSAVQSYKTANGLLSSEGNTITEQSISGLNTEIAQARAAQAEVEARVSTAKSQLANGSNGEDVGESLSSPVVQQLRAQRAETAKTIADLQGRYGPKHPDFLKAQRQLEGVDSQIRAEVQRIISGLEAQAQVARQRTASLQASLARSSGTLSANNSATVHLNELQRNAESVKTLYQSFLDRFKQTSAEQGIEQSDARVLAHAQTPARPSSPNVPLNLLLGVVLGVGFAAVATALAEALNQGLTINEEVESTFGLTALPSIPHLNSMGDEKVSKGVGPLDYIVKKPMSPFAEALRTLNTAVSYSNVDREVKIVAVASSLPGEGKTTTCLGLARTAALAGKRVIVVDCDLRRRSAHKFMGAEPEAGLLQVLSGEVRLEDALMRDSASGAYILPLARAPYSPTDVFGSEAMERLLQALRSSFDLILLDTPPVLAVAEAPVIAAKADAVLFLVLWQKTSKRLVRNSLKTLRGVGASLAGISLVQVDAKAQARAGYGDGAYYYKQYRKYYAT